MEELYAVHPFATQKALQLNSNGMKTLRKNSKNVQENNEMNKSITLIKDNWCYQIKLNDFVYHSKALFYIFALLNFSYKFLGFGH